MRRSGGRKKRTREKEGKRGKEKRKREKRRGRVVAVLFRSSTISIARPKDGMPQSPRDEVVGLLMTRPCFSLSLFTPPPFAAASSSIQIPRFHSNYAERVS